LPPPNGTTVRSSSPKACLNSSIERCGVVPMPGDAMLNRAGSALMSATSSCTLRAGTDGWAMSAFGAPAALVIGTKSLSGSYGTL